MSNYQTNGEFDLIDFEAIRHEEFYSCWYVDHRSMSKKKNVFRVGLPIRAYVIHYSPEPYPDITYVIKMKRRPLFYVFNLILPCLLINGIGKLSFFFLFKSDDYVKSHGGCIACTQLCLSSTSHPSRVRRWRSALAPFFQWPSSWWPSGRVFRPLRKRRSSVSSLGYCPLSKFHTLHNGCMKVNNVRPDER